MERKDPPLPDSSLKVSAALKASGEFRDGLLVFGSGLYVAGYIVWALYAGMNGLGAVPVLDAQYFAAGALPLLIALILLRAIEWLHSTSKQTPTPRRKNWGRGLIGLGAILLFLDLWFDQPRSALIYVALVFLSVGFVVFGGRNSTVSDRRFAVFALTGGASMILVTYTVTIFPRLPSEFGGPAPKCVRLDLRTEDTSTETIEKIAARPWELSKEPIPKTFQTRDLYFVGFFSGYAVVAGSKYHSETLDRLIDVSRIRLEVIKAIHHSLLCPKDVGPLAGN